MLLQPNLRDKLTALEAGVTASLPASSAALPAVLASRPGTTTHTAITRPVNIQKNCGPDNLCVPDLQVGCLDCIGLYTVPHAAILHWLQIGASSSLTEYSVGSEERLVLQLEISNRGEDAYETNFYLGANH